MNNTEYSVLIQVGSVIIALIMMRVISYGWNALPFVKARKKRAQEKEDYEHNLRTICYSDSTKAATAYTVQCTLDKLDANEATYKVTEKFTDVEYTLTADTTTGDIICGDGQAPYVKELAQGLMQADFPKTHSDWFYKGVYLTQLTDDELKEYKKAEEIIEEVNILDDKRWKTKSITTVILTVTFIAFGIIFSVLGRKAPDTSYLYYISTPMVFISSVGTIVLTLSFAKAYTEMYY